jgi:hypothetical protein
MEWYREGLRFSCTACGDCCSGEPGVVWVDDEELSALAEALGLEAAEVERQYTRRLGVRRALFERFDGDCIFLDAQSRRCTVYPARPVQCRTWPFWHENVASPSRWQQTCEVCPGAGNGELHSVERIRERLRAQSASRSRR